MTQPQQLKVLHIDDLMEELETIKKMYGNLPLVYASDEEGNNFQFVRYSAGTMTFEGSFEANENKSSLTPSSVLENLKPKDERFLAVVVN